MLRSAPLNTDLKTGPAALDPFEDLLFFSLRTLPPFFLKNKEESERGPARLRKGLYLWFLRKGRRADGLQERRQWSFQTFRRTLVRRVPPVVRAIRSFLWAEGCLSEIRRTFVLLHEIQPHERSLSKGKSPHPHKCKNPEVTPISMSSQGLQTPLPITNPTLSECSP